MHILLIHQAFASHEEGGGTRHYEMARYLSQLGHRVTIIASPISYLSGKANKKIRWKEVEVASPEITIIRAFTYKALHRSFFHRIINFFSFMFSSFFIGLRIPGVDLVWGTSPPIFQGVTAWALSKLKRVPFLFEVRDLWPQFAVDIGVLKNKLVITASEWLERFLYSHSDLTVVNSPGFVDHVMRNGARVVELVPNGVDTSMFDPHNKGMLFRQKYHLEDKFIALYAGAHGMANDLDTILESAKILRNEENIVFTLIGDGKEKPKLVEKAKSMQLSNVLFLPVIPKTEIPEALAAANACIAILKPIESFKTTYPNKVFDYMAAGRPTILAIDGVIREVVEMAQAGIIVQPGNQHQIAEAIHTLVNNPEKSVIMGMNGRNHVEKYYDRAQLTQKFVAILESLRNADG